MALQTGDYEPHTTKRVYVWKDPDVNGNGEQVTRTKYDPAGNNLGQEFVTDRGTPVKHYKAPEGFREVRSFDNSVAHVLHDADGNIVRNKNQEAINIAPGQAVVVHPDGSSEVLHDDWSRYKFEQSHRSAGSVSDVAADPVDETDDVEDTPQVSDAELEEFRAWKAQNPKGK